MQSLLEKIRRTYQWFIFTSTLIGVPVVLILLIVGAQKTYATLSCYGWSDNCEYAFGATDGMAQYMGELLASNPGNDIVVKRNK